MAIDMIPEIHISSLISTTPRISFSNNLDQQKHEDYSYRSDSSSDFDFCINNTEAESSSADELFSDGLILPLQLQEKFVTSKSYKENLTTRLNNHPSQQAPIPTTIATLNLSPLPPLSPPNIGKEIVSTDHIESEQKHQSKSSFWSMKRSSSLHYESTNDHKKSSFWSLPLLSRSKSTGSTTTVNTRQQKRFTPSSSSSGGVSTFYPYPLSQKPRLKKSYGGSMDTHTNGVRINSALNVQSSCSIKGVTANFLGFGYLFRNGKETKSTRSFV